MDDWRENVDFSRRRSTAINACEKKPGADSGYSDEEDERCLSSFIPVSGPNKRRQLNYSSLVPSTVEN